MSTDTKSYEKSLRELEGYVEKIKNPENTLEELIKTYEAGMERYRECKRIIEEAKQTVAVFEGEEA